MSAATRDPPGNSLPKSTGGQCTIERLLVDGPLSREAYDMPPLGQKSLWKSISDDETIEEYTDEKDGSGDIERKDEGDISEDEDGRYFHFDRFEESALHRQTPRTGEIAFEEPNSFPSNSMPKRRRLNPVLQQPKKRKNCQATTVDIQDWWAFSMKISVFLEAIERDSRELSESLDCDAAGNQTITTEGKILLAWRAAVLHKSAFAGQKLVERLSQLLSLHIQP